MSPDVKDAKESVYAAVGELLIMLHERDSEIRQLRVELEELHQQTLTITAERDEMHALTGAMCPECVAAAEAELKSQGGGR